MPVLKSTSSSGSSSRSLARREVPPPIEADGLVCAVRRLNGGRLGLGLEAGAKRVGGGHAAAETRGLRPLVVTCSG